MRQTNSEQLANKAGFSLVEITMVLILLGILSAVAVPKYFDLQTEAHSVKCKYNRSVLMKAIDTRIGLQVLTSGVDKAYTTDTVQNAIKAACEDIHGVVGADGSCIKLCPDEGTYTVESEVDEHGAKVAVNCSEHGGETLKTVVSADKAELFQNWLGDIYEVPITGGNRGSLADFFSDEADGVVDSEAAGLYFGSYGNFQSMTDAVLQALSDQKFDTQNTVWRISRSGYCSAGPGPCGYVADLTLEIAQKPANYKEGDVLETWKYTSHIVYSNNELDSNGNVVKGGTVQSIVSQSPVKETMTLQTKTDKNGSSYLALR